MGIELKTYSDILSELDNNGETHLLLGNDFNLSIGIDTNYNDIFNKMKERYKGYKDLTIEGDNYDIEKVIGKLKNQLKDSDCKPFLEKFINDRIKLEFMNSAFTIVKDSLKNIHQEKNEGIKVLFKKFTNYFSLDYDPFLCLLLMKYKKPNTDKVIAFQNDTLFILNDTKNNMVKYILEIHANYTKKLGKERENDVVKPFSKLTKSALKQKIREDAKKDHKRISQEDINRAYEQIKNKNKKLKIEDGFRSELFLKKILLKRGINFKILFSYMEYFIYIMREKPFIK